MSNEMTDDLEQQLQRLRFRPLPTAWRREILAAAIPEKSQSPSSFLSFFYPGHYATAALAALWLLIFAFHFTTPDVPRPSGPGITIAQFKAIQFEREWAIAQLQEPELRIEGNRISAPLHRPRS
ncbi:MAG: hypothetical protein PHD76_06900 [Methylacidiphilales bacterium]|nr:hypothetical protein [Candidatus Methylacidiphilales bacterium]